MSVERSIHLRARTLSSERVSVGGYNRRLDVINRASVDVYGKAGKLVVVDSTVRVFGIAKKVVALGKSDVIYEKGSKVKRTRLVGGDVKITSKNGTFPEVQVPSGGSNIEIRVR